jgi:hypothetical protein
MACGHPAIHTHIDSLWEGWILCLSPITALSAGGAESKPAVRKGFLPTSNEIEYQIIVHRKTNRLDQQNGHSDNIEISPSSSDRQKPPTSARRNGMEKKFGTRSFPL